MENEMESGVIKGLHRDPSIQIIPTLGPKVCKYYLHWAIWIPRVVDGLADVEFRTDGLGVWGNPHIVMCK